MHRRRHYRLLVYAASRTTPRRHPRARPDPARSRCALRSASAGSTGPRPSPASRAEISKAARLGVTAMVDRWSATPRIRPGGSPAPSSGRSRKGGWTLHLDRLRRADGVRTGGALTRSTVEEMIASDRVYPPALGHGGRALECEVDGYVTKSGCRQAARCGSTGLRAGQRAPASDRPALRRGPLRPTGAHAPRQGLRSADWVRDQARTSRIMLAGVWATRRTRVKPASVSTSRRRFSPAWAPSARPTSWLSEAGVQRSVDAE